MSTILDYLTNSGKSKQTSEPPLSDGIAKVLKPQQASNMGRQIMQNMESVMKSLKKKKKKHKKHRQKKANQTLETPTKEQGDAQGVADSLANGKSTWLTARTSKPPQPDKHTEESDNDPDKKKKNAFKMLMLNGGKGDMASNDENQTRKVSPDAKIGKRKLPATQKESAKRRKLKTAANEDPDNEEDSPKSPVKKRRKKKLFECYVETIELKKASVEDPPLLVVDTESEAVDTPSRPRRSCASKVTYVETTSPISSKKTNGKVHPATVTSKTVECVPVPEEPALIVVIDVEAMGDQSPATETTKKKLAPLFVKALPKPTVDPKILEARQSFLKSDIPDKMRQEMEKKRLVQEEVNSRQLCLFPEISHVPRTSGHVYLATYDDLTLFPKPDPMSGESDDDGPLRTYSVPETMKVTSKKAAPRSANVCAMYLTKSDAQKKKLVREMKSGGASEIPTYKLFKMLTNRQTAKAAEDAMFTDKFKPSNSQEFIFNLIVINELKDYLERFINPSSAETGSSYETDDDDEYSSNSMDSFTTGANAHGNQTVVLYGPCSTGKTSAVYAIANELKCNVIEINASSKRKGANVLHKLMEATQSHKVPTAKMSLSRKILRRMERDEKLMSIILIEDVDLIFEEDIGFLAAITQLMSLTKRPIILTTNDRNSSSVRKFFDSGPNFKFLHFRAPPRTEDCLSYLTLIGLVNGCHIDWSYLQKLFESCNEDLRRAMLQLNFITMTKEVILHWEEDEEEEKLNIPCFNLNDMPVKEDKSGDWCREWAWTLDSLAVADTWTKRSDSELLDTYMEMCSLGESVLARQCSGDITRYEDSTFEVANSISNYRNRSCTRPTKLLALDVEPILRGICRSECDRKDNGKQRSSTKFSHYLLREREFEFPNYVAERSTNEDLEFFTGSCSVFQAAEEL